MQGSLFGNQLMTDTDRLEAIAYHKRMLQPHYDAIRDLKETCPHNDVERVSKSDTGNWCRDDDSYWTACKCKVCGNSWNENYSDGYGRR